MLFWLRCALDPANAICRYNLGCVYEEAGKIDEAIENLRCAIRAMPNHADAHFNLALAYEKKGDAARAREHWAHYLKHDPTGDVGGEGADAGGAVAAWEEIAAADSVSGAAVDGNFFADGCCVRRIYFWGLRRYDGDIRRACGKSTLLRGKSNLRVSRDG